MFAHHFNHALKILVRTDHELHHVVFAEQLEILTKHLVFHARRRQLVVHRDTEFFWTRSGKLRKRDRTLLLPLGIVRDELGKVGRAIGLDLDHLDRFQTSKRMQQAVEIRLERRFAAVMVTHVTPSRSTQSQSSSTLTNSTVSSGSRAHCVSQ